MLVDVLAVWVALVNAVAKEAKLQFAEGQQGIDHSQEAVGPVEGGYALTAIDLTDHATSCVFRTHYFESVALPLVATGALSESRAHLSGTSSQHAYALRAKFKIE